MDQTSPEDGAEVHPAKSIKWNNAIRDLAININKYADMNAYFEWVTPGTGSKLPREPNLKWKGDIPGEDEIEQTARADYYRGIKKDENIKWIEVIEKMTEQDIVKGLRYPGEMKRDINEGRWLLTKVHWLKSWSGHTFAVVTFNSHNLLESNIFLRPMEKYIELWEICRKYGEIYENWDVQ